MDPTCARVATGSPRPSGFSLLYVALAFIYCFHLYQCTDKYLVKALFCFVVLQKGMVLIHATLHSCKRNTQLLTCELWQLSFSCPLSETSYHSTSKGAIIRHESFLVFRFNNIIARRQRFEIYMCNICTVESDERFTDNICIVGLEHHVTFLLKKTLKSWAYLLSRWDKEWIRELNNRSRNRESDQLVP